MKFSEKWLREWVDPRVTTAELAEQLTTVGLEVDSVESVAGDFDGVVVGRVQAVQPHPEADKLRLCMVEFGTAEPVEVVCGASNVRVGLSAPFAPVGARVAGGTKIRASKIRSVKSHGMLCSEVELGLGEDGDGLLALSAEAVPGTPLEIALDLDDVAIDVDLTPNRGDCLSMLGIAREIAVVNRCEIATSTVEPVAPAIEDRFPVALDASQECPRYVGRVVRDIDPGATTPLWLVERLRRCGVRAISPVVDVTNFVMLELGQPLHAFDLDTLRGGIRVRKAHADEPLELLDGQVLELDSDILVIADEERAVAMAGIMGGGPTGVTEQTSNLFLESAYFEPRHVAGDARRFGLHTDASHRFERGVDPDNQARAIERATGLLLEIVGGSAGPVTETVVSEHLPERVPVKLRAEWLERVLGTQVDADQITDILERLDLQVLRTDDGWEVTPPGFRFDIAIEADLVEEVARVIGYDSFKPRSPVAPLTIKPRREASVGLRQLRSTLVNRGYREAITYSFVDPGLQHLLTPEAQSIELANPISSDMRVMRTGLWAGLLQAMIHNTNRQQAAVRLFESGLTFQSAEDGPVQRTRLGGLLTGPVVPRQWGTPTREADFFDLKADVETLLDLGGNGADYRFETASHPALHPGQCAAVTLDQAEVGWVGMMHPRIPQTLKHGGNVFVFELDLEVICRGNLPEFKVLSKYPTVIRDISILLDDEISAQAVRDCVGQRTGDVLKNLELFDVYHGEGIDSGKKSLSLSMTFQASSHTLNDEEVESLVTNVMDALGTELGASLRG